MVTQNIKLDLQTIEQQWKSYWLTHNTYKFIDDLSKEKFYILDMFPYPSGSGLHVGHIKGYLATDIYARYKRMKGFVVLHPIGWDAFGLPAEQYAIKNKKDPREFTEKNISNFRKQLQNLHFAYDYGMEVKTHDPSYYAITQWIFSQLYIHNLAQLKETLVNWCPALNTVLANEEILVINDQKVSERGNHPVEAKSLKQWVLMITKYAEDLLTDLESLDWDPKIKKIQTNWIGKEEKYEFFLTYKSPSRGSLKFPIYLKNKEDIASLSEVYVHDFSNLWKIIKEEPTDNPVLTHKLCPQEISITYKHNIDFREDELIPVLNGCHEVDEETIINSTNSIKSKTVYKLKDWVFSRQRYWGEPLPVCYNKQGSVQLITDLPVVLPELTDFDAFLNSTRPLESIADWIKIDNNLTRDPNTMPNWAGSSWYFIAYLLKIANTNSYLHPTSTEAVERLKRWLPVDIYVGGQEHANLHLLYARFWHKFLHQIKITPNKEPFQRLINQGMILSSDGTKMSKSKGNVVSLKDMHDLHGGDLIRLNMAFLGPTELTQKWDETQIPSLKKWLEKIYAFFNSSIPFTSSTTLSPDTFKLLKNSEYAITKFRPNVIVSELMIFFNSVSAHPTSPALEDLKIFSQILSLIAPAFAEELWFNSLGQTESIYLSAWPKNLPAEEDTFELLVQINNKTQSTMTVNKSITQEEIIELLKTDEKIQSKLSQQNIKKVIYVPKRLINLMG